MRIWYNETGSGNRQCKIQNGGIRTGTINISARRWDRNEISTAKPTFSDSGNPMGLRRILCNPTGSGKSKMAAYKPEVPISRLVDMISKKFKRVYLLSRLHVIQWDWREYFITKPEVENPRWRPPNWKYLYLGLLTWYQRNSKGIVWFSMSNWARENNSGPSRSQYILRNQRLKV